MKGSTNGQENISAEIYSLNIILKVEYWCYAIKSLWKRWQIIAALFPEYFNILYFYWATKMKAESKCFIYYFTVHSEKCINSVAILCINGSTGEKKQCLAASSHRLVTAAHKNHVFLNLTFMGNDFLQNVIILLKLQCRILGLPFLPLQGWERRVRGSVARGEGAGAQRQGGDKCRLGKLHLSAACVERDQNEDSGKGFLKKKRGGGPHTQLN